ncbi:hypothetical protein LguiB_028900 [Lonicera macranthoides]
MAAQTDRENRDKRTTMEHLVFGIAASADLWEQRKNYIKTWWKPDQMRGIVWLDTPVKANDKNLPPGHRSAIRISRIVSETVRVMGEGARWFVMGDDDTIFVVENLVRVLAKYDHNEMYYIGSVSESHLQNIYFSYGMAYGGGGFAISYPLAMAVEEMQDECIERYPELYGSDDRMHACMAEIGIPLTKEVGFHQFDVYGNLFGLLAAHPVAPLVSMHHLDVVDPIFPNTTRVEALRQLTIPMNLDSAGLIQQSICYDASNTWTVSVSWGYAVQIFRGIMPPREVERPARTFLSWYKRADFTSYTFNTRAVARIPCQKPYVFFLKNARLNSSGNETVTVYTKHHAPHPACKWKIKSPRRIEKVVVYKKPDPHLWDRDEEEEEERWEKSVSGKKKKKKKKRHWENR